MLGSVNCTLVYKRQAFILDNKLATDGTQSIKSRPKKWIVSSMRTRISETELSLIVVLPCNLIIMKFFLSNECSIY
jgi:hypothetical protein